MKSNVLSAKEILSIMKNAGTASLPDIEIYDCVGSTNTLLKSEAESGAPHGKVIIALSQTAGRGRLGRSFYSPPGSGLYISILLRPTLSAERSLLLTPMIAVACLRTLRRFGSAAEIKWVNDILIDGRKTAGILVEGAPDNVGGIKYAVVGLGLNLLSPMGGFPDEIKNIACGAFDRVVPVPDKNSLIANLLVELFNLYSTLPDDGFMDEYRRFSCLLGRQVTMAVGDEEYSGRVIDVDRKAHLIVELENGEIRAFGSGEARIVKNREMI